ncbi:nucleotide sugar dehydrogenase [Kitasatospora camelliae]|uniref:Nucleotide sugar dehydrogenase n=1 Tax=Kitasatospora camelliae TaxID=3156397 RepID=A0AAU8JXB7_9ACTN
MRDICVVGLGRIGLPLAVQFAAKGHLVTGTDTDPETVAGAAAGRGPHAADAELDELLAEAVADGRLRASTDTTAAAAGADAVVLALPLDIGPDGEPDFQALDAATDAVAAGLRPGALVSYESTLPVGTLRGRFARRLEAGSGLVAGRDFWLVASPERTRTGRALADLRHHPKLVGGIDPDSTRQGAEFYRAVLDFDSRPDLPRINGVWELDGAETAELAGLAESAYRDVNIALVNQLARFADRVGVDLDQVIEACNSRPHTRLHRPGIAVGGHRVPVHPRLYLWNDPHATVVRAAREANEALPGYAVGLLEGALGPLTGVGVRILGASYRGGVRETGNSGVFPLVTALRAAGAEVSVSDPRYTPGELAALGLPPDEGKPAAALVVQADHPEYRDLGAADHPDVRVLLDGRRITDPARWEGVRRIVLGGGA